MGVHCSLYSEHRRVIDGAGSPVDGRKAFSDIFR